MLLADRFIAAMTGQDIGRMGQVMPEDKEWRRVTAAAIYHADKVWFENVPFELSDKGDGFVQVPTLTRDEWGFFFDNLIPFPAPITWFEYPMPDYDGQVRRSALLISDARQKPLESVLERPGDFIGVERFDLSAYESGAPLLFATGAVARCDFDYTSESLPAGHVDCVHVDDRYGYFQKYRTKWAGGPAILGADVGMAVYLALMLNSQTSEVEKTTPPAKLNKAREKRGKLPLMEHRTVYIVPRAADRERRDAIHAGRAPPRLHWRRTHLRKYKTGKTAIIPRHLVGHAERGMVTHDYKVKA